MKRIAVWLLRLALGLVALVVGLYAYAGVTLTVRNRSGSPLQDLVVDYGRGRANVGELKPGEEWSANVGKIGEGADFLVAFRQDTDEFQADFSVYFFSLNPRTQVVFGVHDGKVVHVWENGGTFARKTATPARRHD